MQKWLRKVLLLVSCVTSAFAWDCCDGDFFEIGADFIWWKPCVDQLEYASKLRRDITLSPPFSDTDIENRLKTIHERWEPGYKVYVALKNFCCLDFSASYNFLRLESKSNFSTIGTDASIVTPLINPIVLDDFGLGDKITGLFSFANAKYKAKYQYADILLGYPICCGCISFRPYMGFAGILFDQKLLGEFSDPTFRIQGDLASTKWCSDAWGAGFKVGSTVKYAFFNCFGLYAQAEGALLAGQYDTCFHQFTQNGANFNTIDIEVKKSSHGCHLFPGYHFAAGLEFNNSCCDVNWSVRMGYELLAWYNLPNHQVFSTDDKIGAVVNSASINKRVLGFHGLFVGVSVSF